MEDERSVAYIGRSDEMGVSRICVYSRTDSSSFTQERTRKSMSRARKLDRSRVGL